MSRAAIRILPLAGGADPVTLIAGEGGTHALAPIGEGVSVGACPVAPDLVLSVSVGRSERAVRARANYLVTSGAHASAPRLTLDLVWRGLSKATRDTLWTFLTVTAGARPFTIAPDRPGSTDPADLLKVAAAGPGGPEDALDAKGAYVVKLRVVEVY